ncbi:MAG TPA: sensor domain-containing diguanylate cyclase [Egibacteraceae bacterium]|nr:sensor domain-containing diguanylate cyclase [Egibacteraceae bacterium]
MTGREIDAQPPAATGGGALAQRLRELRQASAAMRRVRWFGAAFVAVQFTLYRPPAGMELPFPRYTVAAAVLAAVLAVNVASLWSRRVDSPRLLARIGAAELVTDACIVLTVTWLFSFDTTSALWALLIIPVLEGAVRGQLRGAVSTWGLIAVGYLLRDLWAASRYDYAPFLPESVTYRMFIVLIVAITSGLLARNLTRTAADLAVQVRAHREAQRESERRADLLQAVAAAGRHMTSLDLDTLLAIVVDSATGIGFDSAAICLLQPDGGFTVPHLSGLPECDPEETFPSDRGIVGLALRRGETVAVTDPLPWFSLDQPVSFARTVAAPVWSGEEMAAVLVAGLHGDMEIPLHVQECFELLAGQAGAALVNALRYRERRAFEAELQHQAYHDALTGLPNRAAFLEALTGSLAPLGPDEHGDGLVAVLFCDLDRFKTINDTLGHDFGDKLLAAVAERLRQCVKEQDMVARLGGDEFTVLLGAIQDETQAEATARRVIHAMNRPLLLDGREVYVTTSVGIAYGFRGRHSETDLLRAADLAMYQAKDEGRDRYAVSEASGALPDEFGLAAREVVL